MLVGLGETKKAAEIQRLMKKNNKKCRIYEPIVQPTVSRRFLGLLAGLFEREEGDDFVLAGELEFVRFVIARKGTTEEFAKLGKPFLEGVGTFLEDAGVPLVDSEGIACPIRIGIEVGTSLLVSKEVDEEGEG